MTETLEGVRDPLRADPDAENAVVVASLLPKGHGDIICDIDNDGVLRRRDSGEPVPWAAYSVEATDVDPETWGDHYHHPADCPEKDPPASNAALVRSTCDGCTIAEDREYSRDWYRPELSDDFDAEQFREDLEAALDAFPDDEHRPRELMVPRGLADALEEETSPR